MRTKSIGEEISNMEALTLGDRGRKPNRKKSAWPISTFPCTPQQNGMVERMNRTIVEKVRSMLSNPYFPKYFWAEVVHIAFLLTNLSPTTSLDDGIR
jgi:hypothetical protein